ncbi:hypothetical protein DERP_003921 [Dermatophagoides pteronyssinus]|uniref:Uncharacterized protein n=1 Tax=Dermatophagoides pteronyssinus TaxID=6956 RepID=A0ABQ8J7P6_DERPT|nr:hypothetical protein DERP_003921 [Dermatophagoides pteronyssinus]
MVFDYDSLIFFNEKKNCHFRLQVLAWLTDDEFFQFSYFNFILQFGSCNDDLDDEENWFFINEIKISLFFIKNLKNNLCNQLN